MVRGESSAEHIDEIVSQMVSKKKKVRSLPEVYDMIARGEEIRKQVDVQSLQYQK